jgi:Tfp pilus assembly protein PilO
MTLTAPPTAAPDVTQRLWNSMPGWGITANLLPPEVLAARRIAVIRKMIVAGLIAVVVLAGGGYAYAFLQQRDARSQLSAEQQKTTALQAAQQQYSQVVLLAGSITQVKTQLAQLMAADVDTTKLIDNVAAQLPPKSTITQLDLALPAASTQSGTSSGSSSSTSQGGSALDASGQPHIGSLTITGSTGELSEVAGYVNALAKLPGVVSVYPSSEGTGSGTSGVQFTINLTLTDDLLTHRYDDTSAPAIGGK